METTVSAMDSNLVCLIESFLLDGYIYRMSLIGCHLINSVETQGPVARRMVSANHWLKSMESYTFLW